ncbi:MAG TPA: T9SS type A sorting domain-containing protein [Ignavibacteria bacterium]
MLFINPSNSLASLTRYNISEVSDNINISKDLVDVFPNPFNMNTKISLNLQQDGNVRIFVFDVLGREIKLINNSNLKKGNHSFVWNGVDNNNNLVCSGNYFLRINTNNSVTVKRLVVSK